MKDLDSLDLRVNDGDKIRLIKYELIQMQQNISEMKIKNEDICVEYSKTFEVFDSEVP